MNRKFHRPIVLFSALAALTLAGCDPRAQDGTAAEDEHGHAHDDGQAHAHDNGDVQETDRPVRVAVAEMNPTETGNVSGTVTFTRVEEGIRVVAELSGFTEPGPRGFHVHETGDCSAPDATSAGGHFNPHGDDHGARDSDERHIGDLGNIEVDEDGNARIEFVDEKIAFEGEASIIGRAVIVHAGEDDLESQPTGDAGDRVACGVIQATEFEE